MTQKISQICVNLFVVLLTLILMENFKYAIAFVFSVCAVILILVGRFSFFTLLIIWIVLTPIAWFYIMIPLPEGIPDLNAERLLILGTILLLLMHTMSQRRIPKPKIDLVEFFIGLFLLAQLYSVFHTPIPKPEALIFFNSGALIPAMLFVYTAHLVKTVTKLYQVLHAFLFSAFVGGILGIAGTLLKMEENIMYALGAWTIEVHEWKDVSGGRAAGPFLNPAVYGAIQGMAVFISVFLRRYSQSRYLRQPLLYYVLILVFCAGVFLCYTRSAWFGFILSLGLLILVSKLYRWWRLIFVSIAIPVIVIVLLTADLGDFITQDSTNQDLASRLHNTQNIRARLALGYSGWQSFLQKPVFGWGMKAFSIIKADRLPAWWGNRQISLNSHNTYLAMLSDTGLAGFMPYAVVICMLAFYSYRFYINKSQPDWIRELVLTLWGMVGIYMGTAMSVDLYTFGYFNSILWIILAILKNLTTRTELFVAHNISES